MTKQAKPDPQQPTQLVPASPEAEAAFIGACLCIERAHDYPDLRRMVDASCFTRPLWQQCWTAIVDSWEENGTADPVTVAQRVGRERREEWVPILDELMGLMIDPSCFAWYALPRAKLLRELAMRRDLISFGTETVGNAYSEADLSGVLAYTTRMAEMMDDLDARTETGEIGGIAADLEASADGHGGKGWATSIPALDGWCQGLRPGEVYVVGGPSGVGKTWLLSQIANATADQDLRVAFFTLEMTRPEIYVRLLAGRIGFIAYRLMGRGRTWSPDERARYKAARAKLEEGQVRIYTDQRSAAQIASTVRQWRPAVVLVDYMQLLDWPPRAKSEYDALTENANALQRLAKRAGCAMVISTQQSRESIKAGTGSAVQGGMGSGRIDQIADLWVLIQGGRVDGTIELTCRKNRHGTTGGSAAYRLDPAQGRMVPA